MKYCIRSDPLLSFLFVLTLTIYSIVYSGVNQDIYSFKKNINYILYSGVNQDIPVWSGSKPTKLIAI